MKYKEGGINTNDIEKYIEELVESGEFPTEFDSKNHLVQTNIFTGQSVTILKEVDVDNAPIEYLTVPDKVENITSLLTQRATRSAVKSLGEATDITIDGVKYQQY